MLMNDLSQTGLFSLLAEPSQEVTNEEIKNAYGCFMEHIRLVSQSENNHSETFRMLNISRIELAYLQTVFRYEQGKKCPKIRLSSKSVSPCQCRIRTAKP